MIKTCAQVTKIFDFDQNHVQVEVTYTCPYKVEGGQIFSHKIDPSLFPPELGEKYKFRWLLKKPVALKKGDWLPMQIFEGGERQIE
jgi:hypothetical protein